MRVLLRVARSGAFLALVCATVPASAEERDPKLAQSLFDRARELMDAGDLEHACPLFVESQRLDPGGGTLLNIALCHERQGKVATAWAEYGEALGIATRDGRDDRRELAMARVDALRPRLPKLRIVLADPNDGASVTLDERTLGAVSLGLEIPVDPGEHVVGATKAGHRSWSTKPIVAEGEALAVTIPKLAPETLSTTSPQTELAPMSWVLGGVAVVAVGTGIVTGLMALSADRAANDKCVSERDFCPDASYADDASRARTLAWVSTGAFVVGAGALVGAFAWPRRTSARVDVVTTPTSASVSARFLF